MTGCTAWRRSHRSRIVIRSGPARTDTRSGVAPDGRLSALKSKTTRNLDGDRSEAQEKKSSLHHEMVCRDFCYPNPVHFPKLLLIQACSPHGTIIGEPMGKGSLTEKTTRVKARELQKRTVFSRRDPATSRRHGACPRPNPWRATSLAVDLGRVMFCIDPVLFCDGGFGLFLG